MSAEPSATASVAAGSAPTSQERELANLIVQALNLEDLADGEPAPETPLFLIEDGGLGLDSIDALEIALAINEHDGVEIRVGGKAATRRHCVRSSAACARCRTTSPPNAPRGVRRASTGRVPGAR